jgi:hypothetical protein
MDRVPTRVMTRASKAIAAVPHGLPMGKGCLGSSGCRTACPGAMWWASSKCGTLCVCQALGAGKNKFTPQNSFDSVMLTYMATIEDIIEAGRLVVFDLPQWEPRLPIRPLYTTPDFLEWADDMQRLHDPKFGVGGRTLFEHLLMMFCDFRCATRCPPHAGDLRRMIPTKSGIWKMHPPKLRIYGWCPSQHSFVALLPAFESDTKADKSLNATKMKEVEEFIRNHHLESTITRGDVLAVFPNQN